MTLPTQGSKEPYRTRNMILSDILKLADVDGGKRYTKIMYGANLSTQQINSFLKLLLEGKLLETLERKNGTFYKTTSKGRAFISAQAGVEKMLVGRSA